MALLRFPLEKWLNCKNGFCNPDLDNHFILILEGFQQRQRI